MYYLCTEECLIDFQELLGKHTGESIAEVVWEGKLHFLNTPRSDGLH